MSRIERTIDVSAGVDLVWATVSDLPRVTDWNPNVAAAACEGPVGGVGATRTCDLMPRGRIDEVVARWEPGKEIWFAIGSHGGVRSADMGIVLTPGSASTTVTAVTDYHLAFGPLGPVVDRLTMRRAMTRMMDASLQGLKEHIEATKREGHRQ
jgi:hypothetical protein